MSAFCSERSNNMEGDTGKCRLQALTLSDAVDFHLKHYAKDVTKKLICHTFLEMKLVITVRSFVVQMFSFFSDKQHKPKVFNLTLPVLGIQRVKKIIVCKM